jgi:RNA polymerase sigma-70 factor (ECF subfamily)
MQDELVSAAMRGDGPACRDLFDLWYPKAYRAGKAICGSRALAEDAVQEALLRFWRALPRLEKPEAAEGYFLKIVANEARRIRARRKSAREEPIRETEGSSESVPENERERRMELMRAVGRLPESMRTAVRLHYYGGFSEAETADMLRISLPSLKMRLVRARRRLRALLEREGFEVNGG